MLCKVFRHKLRFTASAKVASEIPEVAFAGHLFELLFFWKLSVKHVSVDITNSKSLILHIGRSNVGKSSLINALTRQWGVARTSDKPGLTQVTYLMINGRTLWPV